jgi:hypothetical protein
MTDAPVNVLRFGAKGDGVSDDTSAINAALAAAKCIHLPPGTYRVTGTLTMAQNDAELVLEGGAEIRHTPSATKGLIVSGARCRVSGPGKITSLGTRDATNTEALYAVVWVTGNDCVVEGVRFQGVPKAGVKFYNAGGGAVRNCDFDGEFPNADFTGTNTAHFGVVVDPAPGTYQGQVSVTGCHFRRFVSGVAWGNYGAGSDNRGFLVSANLFMDCHDHGVYADLMNGATITGNTFDRCAVAVVVRGNSSVVSGNSMVNPGAVRGATDRPGISVRDARDCAIVGNTVVGDLPGDNYTAIAVENISGTDTTNNVIANNVVINTSAYKCTGIKLGSALTETCDGNVIMGNTVEGQSRDFDGLISLIMKPTYFGKNNSITGNVVRSVGANYALHLTAQRYLTVTGNNIAWEHDAPSALTGIVINVIDVDYSTFSGNLLRCADTGDNVTLRGLSASGTQNLQITGNNFIGTATDLVGFDEVYNLNVADKDEANSWN